jgi:undecaprenyl-diphosphatase
MLEYIILGVLQGMFEWLPISSQGQIFLIMTMLFGTSAQEALNSSIWLHIGTMFAAVVYFRGDVIKILKRLVRFDFKDDILSFLTISTILTGIVGLPLYLIVRDISSVFGQLFIILVGIALIITGLLQKRAKRSEMADKKIGNSDKVIAGAFQGLSIIPGISRSGITTSVLLFRNFSSSQALKLSFLMSIPAVLVAEVGLGALGGVTFSADYLVGAFFSFIFGLITIDLFLRLARRVSFWAFCVFMGLLTFIPLLFVFV